MSYKQFVYVIILSLSGSALVSGATVITSDAEQPTQSFDFPISQFVYSPQSGGVFTGALSGTPNTFSVALNLRKGLTFVGLTPETVALNNVTNQANPLFNQSITNMGIVGISPLVTTSSAPAALYVIQNYDNLNAISVLSATDINDSAGAVTANIAAISSNNIIAITPDIISTLMALVTPHGSATFGAAGSGVAVGVLQKVANSSPVQYAITLVDATTGLPGNKAFPLDVSTSALKLTNDLTSLTAPVMQYDSMTGIFFAGFQAVAGAGGTRAVVRIAGGSQVAIGEITPVSAIGADSIIGTNVDGGTVNIFNIKTMETSTNLEYLLVVGGVSGTKLNVYALPLVSTLDANAGALANKNVAPVTQFSPISPYLFLGRGFVTPATLSTDLYTSENISANAPAIVGGGPLLGDVTALTTYNDAVIATIATSACSLGGVFITQALFDTTGAIAKWTPWVRAAGTTENIFNIALEPLNGSFTYANGASSVTVNTVQKTGWSATGVDQTALEPLFTKDTAGIQGFFNYPYTTPSFDQTNGERLSVAVATGYNQVVLLQTGASVGTLFTPTASFNGFASSNGTLTGFIAGVNQIAISGGDLASLGAIISSAIVTDGTYGWLVVGGSGGVAILANDDGTGWDAVGGLQPGFVGLQATMKFRKIGNYSFVRKLISASGRLYVLSPQSFERASVTSAAVALGGSWSSAVLAVSTDVAGKYGTFSDAAVSEPLALLATSKGMIRSGNGVNSATVTTADAVAWTAVDMPESPGPVTRLLPLSPTVNTNDFGLAGNLYVLAAAVSTSQARLYRFVINIVSSTVSDTTVQLFPDYYHAKLTDPTVGSPTYFMSLGDYRNYFSTNGANFYFSRSAYLDALPTVHIITAPVRTGVIGLGRQQGPVLVAPEYRAIGQLISNSATGGLCAYGDFGLQVNE